MKIKIKLFFTSILILVLLAGLAFLGIRHLNILYEKSWEVGLKNAPLGDAAMEIQLALTRGHLWFVEIIAGIKKEEQITEVWQSFDDSLWYCDAMLKGGRNEEGMFYPVQSPEIELKIQEVKRKINKFVAIVHQRFENFRNKDLAEDSKLNAVFERLFGESIQAADDVEEMLHQKMKLDSKSMVKHIKFGEISQAVLTVVIALIIGLSLFLLWRGLVRGLNEGARMVTELAAGNLQARAVFKTDQDEIGQMLFVMNAMASKLQTVIIDLNSALKKLATGDTNTRIVADFPGDFAEIKRATNDMVEDVSGVISNTNQALAQLASGDMDLRFDQTFNGDFKQIRQALENTAVKLGEAMEQNALQTWVKNGQGLLGEQISGDKTLVKMAEDVINFITPYLDAHVGVFYLLQAGYNSVEDDSVLKMVASHAHVWRKNAQHQFHIGEGLVGQAALEKKMFVIDEAPENYLFVQSGLGKTPPRMILVAPFLYENEVKGVIELASLKVFTETHLEFLKLVLPALAIAINTAESRNRMKVLLEQSERQAMELRKQQTQMEVQQAELQESNAKLQAQSEELQSQSEELQAQQEELRQTNEELEQRTRELERQQNEVEQKNRDLEKARTAIQLKADELEITGKYKSEFLANMSHELRTPLNSLLILAQMLAENKAGNLNDKQIEQAQTIHNAGADLLNLINDILDLSKVEAGKIQLHIEPFPLSNLLDSNRQRFEPLAERNGVVFNITTSDTVPAQLVSDMQRLQQVITNLCSNAFKFTKQGSVTLHVYQPSTDELKALDLSLDTAHSVAFSVTDTGIGIPTNKQQVIFEAFQQVDGTTSRKYGGTGLGLSISRQLARLLGGDISLHSTENQGSTFTLYVPIHCPKPQSSDAPTATTTPTSETDVTPSLPPQTPPPTIDQPHHTVKTDTNSMIADDRDTLQADDKLLLIIEDDKQFSAILLELGREQGYKCLLAENGQDGLIMAETYKPDGIMLDIGLPLVDGLTVMDRLKQNFAIRHIPVHVISGSEHGQKVKQMGALGYSMKPLDMKQLHTAFGKLRHIIDKEMRRLLLISDSEARRDKIQQWLGAADVHIEIAETAAQALHTLYTQTWDCAVLDLDIQDAITLLKGLRAQRNEVQVPLIFYAERELTDTEQQYLHEWHGESPLKTVYSPERLVDEATLFLHQVEAELPTEKRDMLRIVHDKEAVLKGRKVLLVDDDVRNIYSLTNMLENKGMQVFAAPNGKKALALLKQQANIDVVLMDIMMPEMDGYETMHQIRAQASYRKLPIIVLTAKAMKESRDKCLEAGANDYLSKPINNDQLLSLLRVWLYR